MGASSIIQRTLAAGPSDRGTSFLTVSAASVHPLISISRLPLVVLRNLAIKSPVTVWSTLFLMVLINSEKFSSSVATISASGLVHGDFGGRLFIAVDEFSAGSVGLLLGPPPFFLTTSVHFWLPGCS